MRGPGPCLVRVLQGAVCLLVKLRLQIRDPPYWRWCFYCWHAVARRAPIRWATCPESSVEEKNKNAAMGRLQMRATFSIRRAVGQRGSGPQVFRLTALWIWA